MSGYIPERYGGNSVSGVKLVSGERIILTFGPIAAATNPASLFVAPVISGISFKLISVTEIHEVVASGTCTLQIEKLTATETTGNGDDLLASALNLESTAATAVSVAAVTTAAATMAGGDRLATVLASGADTGLVGMFISVVLEIVGSQN